MTGGPDASAEATPLLHVDMDAFYASVAVRDRPDLVGAPVLVGGGGPGSTRGVVLAASYAARQHQVRSGMPMGQARRLCPAAVVLAPDFTELEAVSASVMEIFSQVTPLVEAMSLDEALLDVSGAARRLGGPREVAEHVRARVADEQQITCSVGVAASVSVAKLASRRAKPDGVLVIAPSQVARLVHPLDVGELYGVGDRTREVLHGQGLRTVGDLAHTPVEALRRVFGPVAGSHLHRLAWGTDRTTLHPRRSTQEPDRSMGAEETFSADTDDRAVVVRELLRLAARVTHRMRRAQVVGRTVAIRVRYSDFTTLTRSRVVPDDTDVTAEVHAVAVALFDALRDDRTRIRLVGVRVEGLRPRTRSHRQLVLGAREHGWEDADRAVDAATERFGRGAVRPATLLLGDRP